MEEGRSTHDERDEWAKSENTLPGKGTTMDLFKRKGLRGWGEKWISDGTRQKRGHGPGGAGEAKEKSKGPESNDTAHKQNVQSLTA